MKSQTKIKENLLRSSHRRCSIKKMILKISQNSNFLKKGTLTQVFSCEFWEICKNKFWIEHLRVIASVYWA